MMDPSIGEDVMGVPLPWRLRIDTPFVVFGCGNTPSPKDRVCIRVVTNPSFGKDVTAVPPPAAIGMFWIITELIANESVTLLVPERMKSVDVVVYVLIKDELREEVEEYPVNTGSTVDGSTVMKLMV